MSHLEYGLCCRSLQFSERGKLAYAEKDSRFDKVGEEIKSCIYTV